MHQQMIRRYENGCMMLMDQRSDGYHFIGTCFIIHSKGYLLTAAHLLNGLERPVVVPPAQAGSFSPFATESGATYPVAIKQVDKVRDFALLQMEIGMDQEIDSPDEIIGNPEALWEGTYLLTIGIPFGHFRVHNIMVQHSMLSAKLLSLNQTNILVFDASVHVGTVGGPLVNSEDGRVVGLIQGHFNPLDLLPDKAPENYEMSTSLSYAVSIEYVHGLFEAEGLTSS